MKKTRFLHKFSVVCFIALMCFGSFFPSVCSLSHSADDETSSTQGTHFYTIDLKIPSLTSQEIQAPDGSNYLLYSFENKAFLTGFGKPQLPILYEKIQVPLDAKNIQVIAKDVTSSEEKLSLPIYPVEIPVLKREKDTSMVTYEFYKDNVFYEQTTAFYPTQQLWIAETACVRDIRYVVVAIAPLQYRPSDGTIKITQEMTIQITWASNTDEPAGKIPAEWQGFFSDMHNVESSMFVHGESRTSGKVSYPTNLADPTNQADYLILTATTFYHTTPVDDLAAHRAAWNGFNVSIVRISDMYTAVGTTIPFDPQLHDTETHQDLEVKTFLKYVNDHWDAGSHHLRYVLLVGDPYPPSAGFYLPLHPTIFYSWEDQVVTDHWYGCINDDNADDIIDDNDTAADLFLGRFSVQTVSQLTAIVSKTLNYELHPPQYPQQVWGTKTLLTSGFNDTQSGWNHLPVTREQSVLPNHFEVTEIYADLYQDNGQTVQDMKTAINTGHALFIHNGHGCPTHWRIGIAQYTFGVNDIHLLQNGDRLPIVFSMSCSTGCYDYDQTQCLAEVFVNEQDRGAVAFLGSSRVSSSGGNNNLIDTIMDAMLTEQNSILGSSIVQGKLNTYGWNINNRLLYNLFGDPALDVSGTFTESEKPELRCQLNSYEFLPDNMVVFHGNVSNIGLHDADNVLIELFESEGKITAIEDATQHIDIPAETVIPLDITIPLQEGWVNGYHSLMYLMVDRIDRVDELCESNDRSLIIGFFIDINPPQILRKLPQSEYVYFRDIPLFHRPLFNASVIIGPFTFTMYAYDAETRVSKVEFYLDGVFQKNGIPIKNDLWVWKWTTPSFGFYNVTIKAYDNLGNIASHEISVWKFF